MNTYAIKIQGHLAPHWSDWFDGLDITHDKQGNTILIGDVPDQSALHGLLSKVRDMNLTLLSLTAVSSNDAALRKKP